MKKIVLSLMAALLLSNTSANAATITISTTKRGIYKLYHYAAYLPIAAVCFLMDAPVMIVSHINQHEDDKLKKAADAEAAEQPAQ